MIIIEKLIKEIKAEIDQNNEMLQADIKVLKKIENQLEKEALIVGGSVRDILMGKEIYDIDIATSAKPEELEKIFKTHDIGKSKDFGIIVVNQDGFSFEIANFRIDSETSADSRRPDFVKKADNFKTDSARRDFTINALGMTSDGEIVDYHNGIEHIQKKILATVGDPDKRFQEDALRIYRLLRFAAKTGFTIDPKTWESAKKLAQLTKTLSSERIRDEFFKAASTGKSLAAFIEKLLDIGLLSDILPEIAQMKELKHDPKHHPEGGSLVLGHVLEALIHSRSKNPLTNMAILFHDLGKITTLRYKENGQPTYYNHEAAGIPIFQKIANQFRLSNKDKEAIEFAIMNHMHGHNMEKLSDKKLLRLRQNPNWDLLADVIYADESSRGHLFDPEKFESKMKKADDVLKKYGNKEEFDKKMKKLINGNMILKVLGKIPGKEIGRIKKILQDWIESQNFNVTLDEVENKIRQIYGVDHFEECFKKNLFLL